MLPHPPSTSPRSPTSPATQPRLPWPGRAASAHQPSSPPCTPALSKSQNSLHRFERRGRDAAPDPDSPLGNKRISAPRSPQSLWSPERVDWGQINKEAALQQNLQQKIVDQIKQQQQQLVPVHVPVEPSRQQQQLQQQNKSQQKPLPVQQQRLPSQQSRSQQSKPAVPTLASGGLGSRPARKAKTDSCYTKKSTPTGDQARSKQQPKVPPSPAQGARPAGQASADEPGQHEPSEQLKARASGWLKALKGRSKK